MSLTKQNWLVFFIMLILVPLAGEAQLHPFSGTFADFRVNFGSPLFLLFLLWLRTVPRLLLGCAAGRSVVLFRAALDVLQGISLSDALFLHVATFFYYLVYALVFSFFRLRERALYEQAIHIALYAIGAELCANVSELVIMNALAFQAKAVFTLDMLARLVGIAILRCFFILSFFYLFQIYTTEMQLARKTRERDRLALLIAGLYEETFSLRCTLQNVEDVTRDCYRAYRTLAECAQNEEDATLAPHHLPGAHQSRDDGKRGLHESTLRGIRAAFL